MAKNDPEQSTPDDLAKPAGTGKGKLILLALGALVALLLVVGVSVGATWWVLGKDQSTDSAVIATVQQAAPTAPTGPQAIYESLVPAFVVNFKHEGRQRYMQVTVALMSRDQAALDALKEHMPVLRNRLVMLFSEQQFSVMSTSVGQKLLRLQATASVQELAQKEVGKMTVEQVLFTNFVLQ